MSIYTKIIEYKPFDETFNNYLIIEIYGEKINHVILNTIRRTILELIPIYAFDKLDIDISINTSIYNNDYMRLRLSQFPIIGIDNDIKNIERINDLEYYATLSHYEQKNEDLEFLEQKEHDIKLEKALNFIMYINIKNTTSSILNVTTNEKYTTYKYQGKNINSPYPKELLIIKLKPGEEFKCIAISSINIGLKNANYIPTSVCVFSEIDEKPKKYHLNIESLKQLSEIEIIIRACGIIEIKLNSFLKILTDKIKEYKSNNSNVSNDTFEYGNKILEDHRIKGIITIENESHTYGNLICRFLQDHSNITYAGYKIDNLLKKELTFAYHTDGTDILHIIKESLNDAKLVYKTIRSQLEKIKLPN